MDWHERIVVDEKVLVGKPIVKSTRLSVEHLLSLMAEGWDEKEILKNYPGLIREDLLACLSYASEILRSERVFPLAI